MPRYRTTMAATTHTARTSRRGRVRPSTPVAVPSTPAEAPARRGFRPEFLRPPVADPTVEERFTATIGEVFRDPEGARERFARRAELEGWGSALREMRHNPRAFG